MSDADERVETVDEVVKRLGLSTGDCYIKMPPGSRFRMSRRGKAALAERWGRKPTDEEIAALEAQMSEEIK